MTKLLCMLALGAAMAISVVSCQKEEPAAPEIPDTSVKGVTITIGAGIDDGLTKSAVNQDGSTRSLIFTVYDQLYVFGEIDDETRVAGLLDMKDGTLSLDGKSAQFTGTIKAYDVGGSVKTYDFGGSDPLALCVKTAATGTLVQYGNSDIGAVIISNGTEPQIHYDAMVADDVNTLMEKGLFVHGAYNSSEHSFALSTEVPIFNCTIGGLTASTYYRAYLKKDGSGNDGVLFQTNASGVGAFAFGTGLFGNGAYTVEIKDNNTSTLAGTIDLGTRSFTSKVYNLSRQFVNLNNVTTTDGNGKLFYAAQNGDLLSGRFSGYAYITIADGATVTLADMKITAPDQCDHATIHCLGDANIILAGDKKAEVHSGIQSNYPAVFVPEGSTLTISGTGELYADSFSTNGNGAGIGGGKNINCGNIVINGGIITAFGGARAAGIGGGINATCGYITMNGGVIQEAHGGPSASGIGSGYGDKAYSGAITINGGQIKRAVAGTDNTASIGCGTRSTCGTIIIGTGITSVVVEGSENNNLIGNPVITNTNCDIFFGNFKAFDKDRHKWYDGDSDAYDSNEPVSCGGITVVIDDGPYSWYLTPATP